MRRKHAYKGLYRMATSFVRASDDIVLDLPCFQSAVDLLPGWVCAFPEQVGVRAGHIELFDDVRVKWALETMGGVKGDNILELGPLEASHTYMLEQAGAARITAVEANKLCYMKCLVAKELLGLERSRFLLGNFAHWLEDCEASFDAIWAAGVLYHMVEPVKLLHNIGRLTKKVHIWTQYIPDDPRSISGEWAASLGEIEYRECYGKVIPHYTKSYGEVLKNKTYCGGVYQHTTWLRRSDILEELARAGFANVQTSFEVTEHQHGPSFAITAMKR